MPLPLCVRLRINPSNPFLDSVAVPAGGASTVAENVADMDRVAVAVECLLEIMTSSSGGGGSGGKSGGDAVVARAIDAEAIEMLCHVCAVCLGLSLEGRGEPGAAESGGGPIAAYVVEGGLLEVCV